MKIPSNFSGWLQWIQHYHDSAVDLGLERIAKLAEELNLTKFNCPVITVAGTNGKGSCVATIEALSLSAGYQVASFTSPHLFHYCERIKINAKPVAELELIKAFELIAATMTTNLSYFEFSTLAALVIFKQIKDLDLIVLEVGLGGRLDAVNIVDCDVAIITSIGLDHTEILGNTRSMIAKEKAGIMRANGVLVCAEVKPPPVIWQQAENLAVKVMQIGRDYDLQAGNYWLSAKAGNSDVNISNLSMPSFAASNAAAAITACHCLDSISLSAANINKALTTLQVTARHQIEVWQGVEFVFDVAHNPPAVEWLAAALQERPIQGTTWGILGVKAGKDFISMLKIISSVITHWVACNLSKIDYVSNNKLADCLLNLNALLVHTADNINAGMTYILDKLKPGDRVVIFGSFYAVHDALQIFNFFRSKNEWVLS